MTGLEFKSQSTKMWATMEVFKELEKLAGVEHDPDRYREIDIKDIP